MCVWVCFLTTSSKFMMVRQKKQKERITLDANQRLNNGKTKTKLGLKQDYTSAKPRLAEE